MTRGNAAALGLDGAAALSRACDRATAERPAGAPLFWTLGANQVGKAAIAAWRTMLSGVVRRRGLSGSGRSPAHSVSVAPAGGVGGDLPGRSVAPPRDRAEGQQAAAGGPYVGCEAAWLAMAALGVLPDPAMEQAMRTASAPTPPARIGSTACSACSAS